MPDWAKEAAAGVMMAGICIFATVGYLFGIVWHSVAMGFDRAADHIAKSPDNIDKWRNSL